MNPFKVTAVKLNDKKVNNNCNSNNLNLLQNDVNVSSRMKSHYSSKKKSSLPYDCNHIINSLPCVQQVVRGENEDEKLMLKKL